MHPQLHVNYIKNPAKYNLSIIKKKYESYNLLPIDLINFIKKRLITKEDIDIIINDYYSRKLPGLLYYISPTSNSTSLMLNILSTKNINYSIILIKYLNKYVSLNNNTTIKDTIISNNDNTIYIPDWGSTLHLSIIQYLINLYDMDMYSRQ